MNVIYTSTGVTSLSGLNWLSPTATVADPDPFVVWQPFRQQASVVTLGGQTYTRERYSGWQASLTWTAIPAADVVAIQAWWQTTKAWALQSAIQWDGQSYLVTAPTGVFPFVEVGGNHWSSEAVVFITPVDRVAT